MPWTYRIRPAREWSRAVFTLDLRSLALFRIGLGLMVLSDHAMRALGLEWFYTDQGVYPTRAVLHLVKSFRKPCVHALSGSIEWQIGLFALASLAALALIVGWRTRTAAVVCWFLTISLQHRFVQINSGADVLLAGLLFFSMFLPLGARLSLDARRRPDRSPAPHGAYSVATACLVGQILLLYAFNALNKTGWAWRDGTAVARALHIDQYATPLGVWVRDVFPGSTYPFTWGTLVLEFAVFLLLVPVWKGRLRTALVAGFWALHVGFAALMYLALFSPVSMVAWLAVLPSEAWGWRGLRAWARCAGPGEGPPHRLPRVVAAVLLATFLVLPTWSNFDRTFKVRRPASVTQAARWLRLNQIWKMFAPAPLKTDFWWVVEARRKDGKKVDLMREGAPLTFGKPPYASQMYLTGKHRRLWMSLKCKSKPLRCKRLLDRMCRDHNAGKAKDDKTRVVKTTLWKMNERTPKKLHVKPKVKKRREFRRTCPGSRGSPRAGGGKKKGKGGKKAKLRRGKKKRKSTGKPPGKSGVLAPPPPPKRDARGLGVGGPSGPWLRPATLKGPRAPSPKPRPSEGLAPSERPPVASP